MAFQLTWGTRHTNEEDVCDLNGVGQECGIPQFVFSETQCTVHAWLRGHSGNSAYLSQVYVYSFSVRQSNICMTYLILVIGLSQSLNTFSSVYTARLLTPLMSAFLRKNLQPSSRNFQMIYTYACLVGKMISSLTVHRSFLKELVNSSSKPTDRPTD